MKKIALILLISIYSLATMGVSLKEFYCCGKLKSVNFSLRQETKDKCGKGTQKGGCCNSKFQFFKVKDKHFSPNQVDFPVKNFVDLQLYNPSFQNISYNFQISTIAFHSNAPPLHSGIPIYIYNRVFRI